MTATITVTPTGTLTGYDDLRLLEALGCAIGEELNAVGGTITTRLFAELAADATQAIVESTLGFPDAGRVFIAGAPYTYTGKTDGTLDGLAPSIATLTAVGLYSEVTLDASSIRAGYVDEYVSQIERAFRDITPGLSTAPNLQRLATIWGLGLNVEDSQLRAGIQIACFAPRDRRQLLLAFLEAVLSDRNDEASVTLSTTNQQRITVISGVGFAASDVGRWLRLSGTATADGLYEIRAYVSATAADVNKVPGLLYGLRGASWVVDDAGVMELLPFSFEEDPQFPATVTVRFWQFDGAQTPGDYLQPASVWLLYNFGAAFTVGASIVGGLSGATATVSQSVDNGANGAIMLCDAVGTFQDNETITETSGTFGFGTVNGTAGAYLLAYDTEAGGGFTVGDDVTGVTSGMVGTLTGLQDDGTSGLLTLALVTATVIGTWTDNEALQVAAVTRGTADGDARVAERPDGQDAWGYITRDERVDGSTGRPLYLAGGGCEDELANLLQRMVAAGVWARCRVGGWVE